MSRCRWWRRKGKGGGEGDGAGGCEGEGERLKVLSKALIICGMYLLAPNSFLLLATCVLFIFSHNHGNREANEGHEGHEVPQGHEGDEGDEGHEVPQGHEGDEHRAGD